MLIKVNPRLGSFVNHFEWSFGVSTVREVVEAWRPFDISDLAGLIECPTLILEAEAEYAQTDRKTTELGLGFIRDLKCPVTIHEFGLNSDGWGASHCQIGGYEAANQVIFDWLDKVVVKGMKLEPSRFDTSMLKKYFKGKDLDEITEGIWCSTI
jgi:hypothetical protein